MEAIVEFFKSIPNFFSENNNFIMTIATMIVGIVAGWFPTLKKPYQITLTVIVAIIFNVIVGLCFQSLNIIALAIILSATWCLLSLLVFKREEVSRRKIGKLIVNFTETADKDMPICIFGGDLNFFGNYIPQGKKNTERRSLNDDIETNEQFTQIIKKGVREIKILGVKPYADTDDDIATRIRIGYIVSRLGNKVHIKFFKNHLCKDCARLNECIACNCNNCTQKSVCTKAQRDCDKLKKYCQNYCYNPDTTLRGRIVTNKDSHSNCVAIATTKESGKKYILREYSAVAKEFQLYQVIWEVWGSKCEADDAFIDRCKREYEAYRDQNKW